MIVDVVTLFPEMFSSVLSPSLLGRAVERGQIAFHFVNPRDFSGNRHNTVDDTPYGGGAGMVMRPEPLCAALEAAAVRGPAHKILLSPTGKVFSAADAARLANHSHLLFVCGRYEGFDHRVRTLVDEELSIGDYVLSGGELGAMVVIDAVMRRLPGVLGNADSIVDESFEAGVLEYPQYTKPAEFRGMRVPDVLLSGNHEKIRLWRRLQALRLTQKQRPDLFEKLVLSAEDRRLLDGETL